MNAPWIAAARFGIAVAMGMGLGVYYGFLRPLRRHHVHIADLLFMPGLLWAWLYLSFAVCQADIRPVYTLGLLAGIVLWEQTLGRLLRPVNTGIWRLLKALMRLILWPFRKIFQKTRQFIKFLFAITKKWSTIK